MTPQRFYPVLAQAPDATALRLWEVLATWERSPGPSDCDGCRTDDEDYALEVAVAWEAKGWKVTKIEEIT